MRTKKIGIVLENRTENSIRGCLMKVKVYPELDEFSRIVMQVGTDRVGFILNLRTNEFAINAGTIDKAYEVGEELKKIGYKDLTLLFKDKRHKIE